MEQFKRAKVVMLPTDKIVEERIGYYREGLSLFTSKSSTNRKELSLVKTTDGMEIPNPQHLYITSDDEIKEEDYGIGFALGIKGNGRGHYLFKQDGSSIGKLNAKCNGAKKVLATTDTSLTYPKRIRADVRSSTLLPQPSPQFIERFIEAFNKGEVITDVCVEYQQIATYNTGEPCLILKLDKDNTINISI